MLKDLKVAVKKKQVLDDKGHYRFYPPGGKGTKAPMIYFNKVSRVRTEKQLLQLIYSSWGPGEYLLIGYCKGRKGCWVFWRGEVTDEGFIFFKKSYNKKNVEFWEREIRDSDSPEDLEELQRNLEEERRSERDITKKKKYGFEPFLQKSSRRGEMFFWNDDGLLLDVIPQEEKTWKEENNDETSKQEEWDYNKKEVEFESW